MQKRRRMNYAGEAERVGVLRTGLGLENCMSVTLKK
jgi:hypothetical protein